MALDTRPQNVGMTADKIDFKYLLAITSYQGRVTLPLGKPTSEVWSVRIANSIEDDAEEREWDALFAQPHVQAGLDRLAKEAERQLAAGEIEEGGFAVE